MESTIITTQDKWSETKTEAKREKVKFTADITLSITQQQMANFNLKHQLEIIKISFIPLYGNRE